MPERNASIAAVLDEIADLLDIQGANSFRVRAYRNAARSIGDLGTEVDVLMETGTALTEIPGIGTDLAKKIVDILHTGTCEFLERLHSELPAAITQLLKIPALGPRRVRTLYQDLHIENLEQLLQAAQTGQIRGLPGFGEKTEQRILEAVQGRIAMARRHPLAVAASFAEPLAEHLRAVEGVARVDIAGSYRRMRATVGDIDMVAIAADSTAIMERFVAYPSVTKVISKGPTRSSVLLVPGLQVDLRSLAQESFGAAMVYFTGSKAHNIAIRRMGQDRGLKINEYGVFREATRIAGETEESVYATIDLPWIPPELRENRGEIEAAQKGTLPKLVQPADLRGDLHLRGKPGESAAEVVAAARARSFDYVCIVFDAQAFGDDAGRVRLALAALDRPVSPRLLTGIEVGIAPDGTLDTPDAILRQFDLVIAAVWNHLDLSRAQQTQRVLNALRQARVAVLAQPLAIDGAERFDVDFSAIVRAATERGVALEFSLHPRRLAPPDSHLEIATRDGARIVISSEAEEAVELDILRFSVGFAGRGGLEPAQVLNSLSLSDLGGWLESHRAP
jgi:DNA polymerase (family X)